MPWGGEVRSKKEPFKGGGLAPLDERIAGFILVTGGGEKN